MKLKANLLLNVLLTSVICAEHKISQQKNFAELNFCKVFKPGVGQCMPSFLKLFLPVSVCIYVCVFVCLCVCVCARDH